MMGRQKRDQAKLFYEFRLDDRIPKNHLLRRIDVFVTAALADLHKELEPHYSDIGRPSVDPSACSLLATAAASALSAGSPKKLSCT